MKRKIVMHDIGRIPSCDMAKIAKREALMKQFDAGELRHPYTGAPVNDRRVLQEVIKIKGL